MMPVGDLLPSGHSLTRTFLPTDEISDQSHGGDHVTCLGILSTSYVVERLLLIIMAPDFMTLIHGEGRIISLERFRTKY